MPPRKPKPGQSLADLGSETVLADWDYEANLPYTPKDLCVKSGIKCHWICNQCGYKWYAELSSRSKGAGCPKCANKLNGRNRRLASAINFKNTVAYNYPSLAAEWDKESNEYLPEQISKFSSFKAKCICLKNHKYIVNVADATEKTCCPFCNNGKLLSGFNDLQTKWPEVCINYSEENLLPASEVYYNTATPIKWICHICGHKFTRAPIYMGKNSETLGCRKCANNQKAIKRAICTDYEKSIVFTSPEILSYWDYDKNEREPQTYYANSHLKVNLICSLEHSYIASIHKFNIGQRCPYCSNTRLLSGFSDTRLLSGFSDIVLKYLQVLYRR